MDENVEAESHSASQSGVEKPPNTPEISAHDAEAMVGSLVRDSPLPDAERANEEIPKDGGRSKLPEGGEGEKLPEGGSDKQPAETPAGKLVVHCRKGILLFALSVIK